MSTLSREAHRPGDVVDQNATVGAVVTRWGPTDAVTGLTSDEQDRYAELMVFAADVHIPLDVPALLWRRAGGWERERAARFRDRLSGLGLLTVRVDGGIVLHAHPRGCPADELARLHGVLLDAHRPQVPVREGRSDWARLPDGHYLWSWLATHLLGAGLTDELDALLVDPDWLAGRLESTSAAGRSAATVGHMGAGGDKDGEYEVIGTKMGSARLQ